jgi:TonB-linked SusC/RagA family outer membrane protein
MCLCLLCAGATALLAQNKTISGRVFSAEDNEPVIGATVIVKGTSTGAITSIDGDFTLQVPESATTLLVSYVGMIQQEVPIAPVMTIRLQTSSQVLGEVVVTALGISKEKKALGYAVQDVKSEQLTQGANTSLTGALQGKVSGIDFSPTSGMPGASSKMVIRGSRSFTGNNTPLYVVDGMPVASTSDWGTGDSVSGGDNANRSFDIDPNDIESINILKGQAASALYGMRASNGVVIITTKSGKTARKGKAQISFSSSFSSDHIARAPELQNKYAQGSAGKYAPMGQGSWGPLISELPNDPTYGGNNAGFPGRYFVQQVATAYGLTRDDPEAWVTPAVYDNVSDFFRTGYVWNNSLNVQKATDAGHYSFSLGNASQEGIMPGTGMNRYNAKMAAETELNAHFTTGFTGNFVYSRIDKQQSANSGFISSIFTAPPSYNFKGIPSSAYGDPYTQVSFRTVSRWGNPYWITENSSYYEKNQRFFGNAYLDYKTDFGTSVHSLDVKYTLGTDAYQTNYSDMNAYGMFDGRGDISMRGYTKMALNSLLTATYDWKISDDLAFDALVGNEIIHAANKNYTQSGTDFNFKGWNHMNNVSSYNSTESYTQERTVGFFANLSLSYRSMLYLNATGRNDIVSTMPRGNRSFFYPSLSGSFIFTELETLKNDILTFGKLRLSYAEVGMAGTYYPDYYSRGSYGGGFISGITIQYPINGQIGYRKSTTVYDPNLRPQNTVSYEGGLDLTFLSGLFNLNYTFSRQNVTDQIFSVPLARSTGASSFYTNGGKVHTNAHEISLGVKPIDRQNLKWDFTFNFSKIDNYVDELAEGVTNIMLGGYTSPNVRATKNEKYPVVFGASYRRDNDGNIVISESGMPIAGAEGIIARTAADFTLGFNTSLSVYKLRLAATFDWRKGGQIMAGTNGELDTYGVSRQSGDDRDRGYALSTGVMQTGVDAAGEPIYGEVQTVRIPADKIEEYYTTRASIWESRVSDNDFVKLREISLAYPLVKTASVEVNVNVFARNLLLWAKVKNIDPETSQGNNNMAGAFERFSLPQTSSYGLGFNLKF